MYTISVYDNVSNLMLYIDNIDIRLSNVNFSQSHSHQKKKMGPDGTTMKKTLDYAMQVKLSHLLIYKNLFSSSFVANK